MRLIDAFANTLGVQDRARVRSWLAALFLLPFRPSSLPPLHPPLPRDVSLRRYVILWFARELGVRHVSNWREWLLRLFVPPAPMAVRHRIEPKPVKVARVPRVLPILRQAVVALAHAIMVPAWLEQRWLACSAALAQHPKIAYWLMYFAPTRAVPSLKKVLAWVRWLEDEALLLAFAVSLGILSLAATTPLSMMGQAIFATLIVAAGVFLGRMRAAFAPAALAVLSFLAVLRYLCWRLNVVWIFENDADFLASVLLVSIELFFAYRLLFRYFTVLVGNRRGDHADFVLPLTLLMLAPNVFLLSGVRPYVAHPLAIMLYLLPCLLLALVAMARMAGVRHGWRRWVRTQVSGWDIPFPLMLVAFNLAGVLAALVRAMTMTELPETAFHACWACFNIWILRTGGRLRQAVRQNPIQGA